MEGLGELRKMMTARAEREVRDQAGVEHRIPGQEMAKLIISYNGSNARRFFYHQLSSMREFLNEQGQLMLHTQAFLAPNFIMLELLLVGGNNLSEVLYKLTVSQFSTSTISEVYSEQGGQNWHIAKVFNHKTGHHLGAAKLSYPEKLRKLMMNYFEEVRTIFTQDNSPDSPFFVGKGGRALDRVPAESINIFCKASGYDGKWQIRPMDFRCESGDPDTSEAMADRSKHRSPPNNATT